MTEEQGETILEITKIMEKLTSYPDDAVVRQAMKTQFLLRNLLDSLIQSEEDGRHND